MTNGLCGADLTGFDDPSLALLVQSSSSDMHMGQFNLFMHMGRFSLFNADGTVQFVQCRWDSSVCSMQMGQFNLFNEDGTVQFVQ